MFVLGLLLSAANSAWGGTITVTSADDSGSGSLRDALARASDGDTINFASSLTHGTILLTTGPLRVDKSVTILGPGSANLTVDGNSRFRVFFIGKYHTVTISGLTIRNGQSPADIGEAGSGGGIVTQLSTVTVFDCAFTGNRAFHSAGAIANLSGNVYQGQTGPSRLLVYGCTFSDNCAMDGGGAILNEGFVGPAEASVVNSTFTGNSTKCVEVPWDNSSMFGGGAILNSASCPDASASLLVLHSTFKGNTTDNSGTDIYNIGTGLYWWCPDPTAATMPAVTIGNTILDSHAESNVSIFNSRGTVDSLGYNMTRDGDVQNANGGTGGLTATSDLLFTDPMLGLFQDNGGPTFTHALQCGSPAIDQGKNIGSWWTDQRDTGFQRTVDDPAVPSASGGDDTDIGAFEVQTPCNHSPVAQCKDTTVSAGAQCTATASIDGGSHGPDPGSSITMTQDPPGPYPLGDTAVTLTVTDEHGASSTCQATVKVVDEAAPDITCPPDATLQCGESTDPARTGTATATDVCAAHATTSFVDSLSPASCAGVAGVDRTWTANDNSGNQSICLQHIRFVDTTAPVLDCSVANRGLWPPNGVMTAVGFRATAADDCGGSIPTSAIQVQIFSDEGDLAPGTGGFSPDAKDLKADGTLRLRAERAGTSDGRVYLIVAKAADGCGLTGLCTSTVTVAHDQSAALASAVATQAVAAESYAAAHDGAPPPGYLLIGNGPLVGPKQ